MQRNMDNLDAAATRPFQFPGLNLQQGNQNFGLAAGGVQLPLNLQLQQQQRQRLGVVPNAQNQQANLGQTSLAGRLSTLAAASGQTQQSLLSGGGGRLGDNQLFNQNLGLNALQQQQQQQQQQQVGRLGVSGLNQSALGNLTNSGLQSLGRTNSNIAPGLNIQGLGQQRTLQTQGVNLGNLLNSSARTGLNNLIQQQQLQNSNPSNIMDIIRNNQQLNQQGQLNQQRLNTASQLSAGLSAAAAAAANQASLLANAQGFRKDGLGLQGNLQSEEGGPLNAGAAGQQQQLTALSTALDSSMLFKNDTAGVLANKTVDNGFQLPASSALQSLLPQQTPQTGEAQGQGQGQTGEGGGGGSRADLEELIQGIREQGGAQEGGAQNGGMEAPPDRFGLMGLLHVIRMVDQDLTMLALGSNLTDLGLELNSQDKLYSSFASPWCDAPVEQKPVFKLPACFYFQPQRIFSGYLQKLSENSLFYAFYSMPGDEAQLAAAEALCKLGWMYHKERKQWIKRSNDGEYVKTGNTEKGNFLAFDHENWHLVRLEGFTLDFEKIEEAPKPSEKQT